RAAQPGNAGVLVGEQNAERLVNAEQRRDPRQGVDVERDGSVRAGAPAPAVIGRARGISQDQAALLFRQSPEIGDRQKRPQGGRAEAPSLGGIEAALIETLRSRRWLGKG